MFHPDVMYHMAKYEHQERIHAAAQSHEARAARPARPVRPARPGRHYNWFAALANRGRTVHGDVATA